MVSDDPEETDSFLGRFKMWQMWGIVVLAEHGGAHCCIYLCTLIFLRILIDDVLCCTHRRIFDQIPD
jgi:hypothetical protein